MRVDEPPIVVETTYDAPIKTVWDAITSVDLMRQWFFDNIPDFKPEVGFKTQFSVTSEGREFLHMWHVTEVEPLKKIAYGWKYKAFSGDGYVLFELSENNGSTHLKLTVVVTEDYPDDIPEFKRESCIGGWEYFLKDRLKEFLKRG